MISNTGSLTNRIQHLPTQVSASFNVKPKPTAQPSQLNQDYLRFSQNFAQRATIKDSRKNSQSSTSQGLNSTVSQNQTVVSQVIRPSTTSAQTQLQMNNKENKPVNLSLRASSSGSAAQSILHQTKNLQPTTLFNSASSGTEYVRGSGNTQNQTLTYTVERPQIIVRKEDPALVATQLQAVYHFDKNRGSTQSSGQQQFMPQQKLESNTGQLSQSDMFTLKDKLSYQQDFYRSSNNINKDSGKSQREATLSSTQNGLLQKNGQVTKRVGHKSQNGLDILKRRQTGSTNLSTAQISNRTSGSATAYEDASSKQSVIQQNNQAASNHNLNKLSATIHDQQQSQDQLLCVYNAAHETSNKSRDTRNQGYAQNSSGNNIQIFAPNKVTQNVAQVTVMPKQSQVVSSTATPTLHKSLAALERFKPVQIQKRQLVVQQVAPKSNGSREPTKQDRIIQEPNKPAASSIVGAARQSQSSEQQQSDLQQNKRSRTSEHIQNSSEQSQTAKSIASKQKNSLSAIHKTSIVDSRTTNPSSRSGCSSGDAKILEVCVIAEERRKDRMKALTRNLEVCDLLDMRNVQTVAEHAPKITSFLLEEEKRFLLPRDFMKNQKFITEKMRAFLVDWLTELHYKFKMWPETLYVAIGIMDHYLAIVPDVSKEDLQCLGITALQIAGKYEEIYPPDLKTILRVVNQVVTKEQVLQMETSILMTLQFDVTFPSIYRFIERFCRLAQMNERQLLLANYLSDTALLDCSLVKENPSKVAACCIYAVQSIFKGSTSQKGILWNSTLSKHTTYRESDLSQMSNDLVIFVQKVEKSSFQTMKKKYSSVRFGDIARMLTMHNVADAL